MPNHVWSVGGMTLLGPGSFGELHPKLNIGPCGPMATSVFFNPIKLLKSKSKNRDNGQINM